ncbi:unnamed protein product [Strongylus vulgaris]|uniref:Uncharacterized protein n=1 Tax=Strongylus vulgaris TaxID=40348 RepID=A0A3P7IZD5_STRVU|nr:unnamed protein product [Strongylus vulgaris]
MENFSFVLKEVSYNVSLHIDKMRILCEFDKARLSAELRDIVPYLRTLDCYQRPDYSMFYDGLVALMKRLGTKPSDPYDWETKEQLKYSTKPAAWEDAAQFFKSDPVNIHAPPLKVSNQSVSGSADRHPELNALVRETAKT